MNSADLAAMQRLVDTIWAAFALFTGASIGSFLNVVAWRVPAGESIVRPGSHCPRCAHPIAWYDNIPVLSYLVLGARCRHCKTKISIQYPLVEALAGGLGLALWATQGPSVGLLVDAVLVSLLLALALIDLRLFLLPLRMSIALGLLALLRGPLVAWLDLNGSLDAISMATLTAVAGAAVGAGLLALVALLGTWMARRTGRIGPDEEAMGGGDVILIAGIGARLGVYPVLATLFLASVQGAIIGGLMLWLQSRSERRDGTEKIEDAKDEAQNDGAESADFDPAMEKKQTDLVDASAENPIADQPAQLSNDDGDAAETGDDEDWQPPAYAIPFGPFLALAAVEWILFGAHLERWMQGWLDSLLPF